MHIFEHKISYFSVPKCANTTIKHMMFELENGFAFSPFKVSGKTFSIHSVARNLGFEEQPHDRIASHRRFAVLRSPEDRVYSFYGDKFLSGELARKETGANIEAIGLSATPSLDEFIDNLEAYRNVDEFMRSHLCPLSHYLGRDPAYFDRIFHISEMSELPLYLEAASGIEIALRHKRRRAHRNTETGMSDVQISKIRRIYGEDHDLFGKYFQPAAASTAIGA